MSTSACIKVSYEMLVKFLRSQEDACWRIDSPDPTSGSYINPVSTEIIIQDIYEYQSMSDLDYVYVISDPNEIGSVDDSRYPTAKTPDELKDYRIWSEGRDFLYFALTAEDLSNLEYINLMAFFGEECE